MSASADPVAEQPEQPEQPEPQASSSPIAGAPAQTQAEETVQSSQPALSTSQSQSPPTGSPPLQDLSPTNAAVPSTTPHESGKNSPKDVRNSPTEPKGVQSQGLSPRMLSASPRPARMSQPTSSQFWEKLERQEKEKDEHMTKNVLQEITKEAFKVFDFDSNDTCNVHDVGHAVRSLGVNPSQAELSAVIEKITDIENPTKVKLEKFQSIMVDILFGNQMQRDNKQKIQKAFEAIDLEKKGYIEPEKLAGLLTSHGEPFTPEEVEAMFKVAVDPDKGVIFYKDYAALLAND